jgi:hypothetical protein
VVLLPTLLRSAFWEVGGYLEVPACHGAGWATTLFSITYDLCCLPWFCNNLYSTVMVLVELPVAVLRPHTLYSCLQCLPSVFM